MPRPPAPSRRLPFRCWTALALALALLPCTPALAKQPAPPSKPPAGKPPHARKPAPNKPAPDKPAPNKPAPNKPAPNKPAPDKPAPPANKPPAGKPAKPPPSAKPKAPAKQPSAREAKPTRKPVDRVVVRWHARATGGVASPRFITARELAFEARIEALARGEAERAPYSDKHVQNALERHVTEVILAALPVDKAPTPKQVATLAESARLIIEQQVGGRTVLNKAASAEGISSSELNALLRRRARAGWYLDRMVAPMLAPSELELREAHKQRRTPWSDRPFDEVLEPLKRWYVSRELDAALTRYFRNIRTRVTISIIK